MTPFTLRSLIRSLAAALALLAPAAAASGQTLLIQGGEKQEGATILAEAMARPHVLRTGSGPLVIPRDSQVTESLVVLGRATYLASRVNGDVIVVGNDLFLRPGVLVTGRAVSLGGIVASTSLGRVEGATLSLRDEEYLVQPSPGGYVLTYVGREPKAPRLFQLAGIKGVQIPSYDRVNGLSLPVGALVTLGERRVELEPSLTYRSRLGVVDPSLVVRIAPTAALRLEGRVARDTRSNERWINGDLINSLGSFYNGYDQRNWFRSDIGEARVITRIEATSVTIEPFVGGRFERVSPITAAGNVYTILKGDSLERRARYNPLVDEGHIGSALLGAEMRSVGGEVTHRLRAEVEQSFHVPLGREQFTQLTLDGAVDFPTFGMQHLYTRAHAVATTGSSVPLARYAYLGGGSTLPLLFLLEQGGTDLVYVDSRYHIPIERVQLPVVGPPVLILRHIIGAAGVGNLNAPVIAPAASADFSTGIQDNVGVGLGFGPLRLEVLTGAVGKKGTKLGVGVSLSP